VSRGKGDRKDPEGLMRGQKAKRKRSPDPERQQKTTALQEPAAETTVPFPLTKGGMTYVNAYGLDE
jgi:hypothetical protein